MGVSDGCSDDASAPQGGGAETLLQSSAGPDHRSLARIVQALSSTDIAALLNCYRVGMQPRSLL